MGFLSDVLDVGKSLIGPVVGSLIGGPAGAAVGSALPFMGSNDEYGVASSTMSGWNFPFSNLFSGITAKDLFSAGSTVLPYFATTAGQDQVNEINMAEAERNRQFQREMFEKQFSANVGMTRDANAVQDTWLQQARLFNQDLAQQQMGFIRDMSNTQWQRGVEDMKAAGLSPMLAYSKGGAVGGSAVGGYTSAGSAQAGSVGLPGGNMAVAHSAVPAAFQSAFQMGMMEATLDKARSEARLAREQTETSRASGALMSVQYNKVLEEVKQVVESTRLTEAQKNRVASEIARNISEGNLAAVRGALLDLDIPEAVLRRHALMPFVEQRGETTHFRPGVFGEAHPYFNSLSQLLNSASAAAARGRYVVGH